MSFQPEEVNIDVNQLPWMPTSKGGWGKAPACLLGGVEPMKNNSFCSSGPLLGCYWPLLGHSCLLLSRS